VCGGLACLHPPTALGVLTVVPSTGASPFSARPLPLIWRMIAVIATAAAAHCGQLISRNSLPSALAQSVAFPVPPAADHRAHDPPPISGHTAQRWVEGARGLRGCVWVRVCARRVKDTKAKEHLKAKYDYIEKNKRGRSALPSCS
jgi:hypothetical protein